MRDVDLFEQTANQYHDTRVFVWAPHQEIQVHQHEPFKPGNSVIGVILDVKPVRENGALAVSAKNVLSNLSDRKTPESTELIIDKDGGVEVVKLDPEIDPARVVEKLRGGLEMVDAFNKGENNVGLGRVDPLGGRDISFGRVQLRGRLWGSANAQGKVELPGYESVLEAARSGRIRLPE